MYYRNMADELFPCWCMGLFVLYLIWNSDYRDLLKISKEGLIGFAKILSVVTVGRIFYTMAIAPDSVLDGIRHFTDTMPWQTLLGVYWEDACWTLPLVVLGSMIDEKKWLRPFYLIIMAIMSLTFGAGHAYEGLEAVAVMSAYIPCTIMLGKKYGFGTIMICHIVYDLITFFTFKTITGL